MFIAIVSITLAFVGYIAFRHWVKTARLSSVAVQQTLQAIGRHISLEEWDLATSKLIPLLENKKGGKQATLFHIQVLRQRHAYKEALEKVINAVREHPEELLFRLEEAKILHKLERYDEALEAFKVCNPILRTESDVYAYASTLLQAGYPRECFEMIEPWLMHAREGKLFSLAARAHFELKDFGRTIAYYHQAMELGYRTHKLLIQLGEAYRRHGNLKAAEALFRSLLEKDSMDITALLGLGTCLQERGHYQKALLLYQSGKLWEQKDDRLLTQAALCALNLLRYEPAEQYLSELLDGEATSPKILFHYGYCLEKQKKWTEAEKVYLELIQSFPADPNGYRALAWMYGVGITTSISNAQGLNFAHIALNIAPDPISWEILSACEARSGNFGRAYEIQKALMGYDQDRETRVRRQQSLRKLRQELPLTDNHVIHTLVA